MEKLTRMQFEERLKQAAPGDTITVYSSGPGWTEHELSLNRFPYLYWKKGAVDMPIHANHIHKLTTKGGRTWERR